MSRVRSKNTTPEWKVRRLAHGMGYRYRLHVVGVCGRPDLVFPSRRKVILVHGCFWHRHPDPACWRVRVPKSRTEFWLKKFADNVARDQAVLEGLANDGWEALVVWECELRDEVAVRARIAAFLGPAHAGSV
jgi:DNA mismatch endonuclease (patch repair protein)